MIKAHSEYQYNKCQEYLKGNITINNMFPLMANYRDEIVRLLGWNNVMNNQMSDKECCYKFCKAMSLSNH